MVKFIRVSSGTAAILGLTEERPWIKCETAYLLTARPCLAKCKFCSQSVKEKTKYLSRIEWPKFELELVGEKLRTKNFKRVCIQCTKYPELFQDLIEILEVLALEKPISISAPPFDKKEMKVLKELNTERIGIHLDCVNEKLFSELKPFYNWDEHFKAIKAALKIFGDFRVTSHLIVGLGEKEEEVVAMIDNLHSKKVLTSLFPFTPIKGTPLESRKKPPLWSYRKLQVAHYLIHEGLVDLSDITFNENGEIIDFGIALERLYLDLYDPYIFSTRGCPNCRRPYYTESPGGEMYNYPYGLSRDLIKREVTLLKKFL